MVMSPDFLAGPPDLSPLGVVCPDERPAMTTAAATVPAASAQAAAPRREDCIVLTLLPGTIGLLIRPGKASSPPVSPQAHAGQTGSLGRPSWGEVNKKSIVFTYLISTGSLPATPLRYCPDAGNHECLRRFRGAGGAFPRPRRGSHGRGRRHRRGHGAPPRRRGRAGGGHRRRRRGRREAGRLRRVRVPAPGRHVGRRLGRR